MEGLGDRAALWFQYALDHVAAGRHTPDVSGAEEVDLRPPLTSFTSNRENNCGKNLSDGMDAGAALGVLLVGQLSAGTANAVPSFARPSPRQPATCRRPG